jgi:hypothetical protein
MVSHVFSGSMVGLLMASIFITASMVSLSFIIKRPPVSLRPALARVAPAKLALSIVALAYPLWAMLGGFLGLVYSMSMVQVPGGGIGSPNLFYTGFVVFLAVAVSVPPVVLLRGRPLIGMLSISASFLVIFGWFFPYFAAA